MKSSNTVSKEIARLYSIGVRAKGVPYESTIVTETMMNLYLSEKYGIVNPFQEDIVKKYNRYSGIATRQITSVPIPEYLKWEFYIYFDKKNKLLSHNGDEYADICIYGLNKLAKLNPGKKITFEFNSCSFVDDKPEDGHTEIIIFDPALNVLEYIDSNQLPKQRFRKQTTYITSCQVRYEVMKHVAEQLPSKPIFITNRDIYNGYEWGIQSIECGSDLLTGFEKDGFCLMWAHLFGDLALAFPEYSMNDIIRTMLKKANDPKTKAENMSDYFVYLIRGYILDISNTLGVDFGNDASKKNACILLASRITQR
jgi:hypothetical protein